MNLEDEIHRVAIVANMQDRMVVRIHLSNEVTPGKAHGIQLRHSKDVVILVNNEEFTDLYHRMWAMAQEHDVIPPDIDPPPIGDGQVLWGGVPVYEGWPNGGDAPNEVWG